MSVKYSWSRQNGAAVPPVRFMSIEPAEDYYKGMPLKLKEKGIVEPTDGDPEYICMAQYDPDAEIQPLEIPVQEVFPDVIYEKINNDGTTEEVRFGSRGGGGGIKTVNGQEPDANGNVEVPAGVQSDWNQNNPESPDYVKNRPFYETDPEPLFIEFDGNIVDGMETVEQDGLVIVKLSNDPLTADEFIGAEITVNMGGQVMPITVDSGMIQDGSSQGLPMVQAGDYVISISDSFSLMGMPLTRGLWTMYMPGMLYVQSISCPSVLKSRVVTLPEKFLNADAIVSKGLGYWNGKLNDWYYLQNVPFGAVEEQKSVPHLTWDGDTSGKEVVAACVDDNGNGTYFCRVFDDLGDYEYACFGAQAWGTGFYINYGNLSHVISNSSDIPRRCVYEFPTANMASSYCLLGQLYLDPGMYLVGAGAVSKKSVDTRWGFHLNRGVYFAFQKQNGDITEFVSEIRFYRLIEVPDYCVPRNVVHNQIILNSSTSKSSKKFIVTVDDSGTLKVEQTDSQYDALIGTTP